MSTSPSPHLESEVVYVPVTATADDRAILQVLIQAAMAMLRQPEPIDKDLPVIA